ncbi:MAG: endonuclease III [Magnetococcales bacterium]|nr:endonuclease III [Magnetococcales bacterium]
MVDQVRKANDTTHTLSRAECTALLATLRAANPHPVGALVYHSPFELLVAVILSAQATDVGVNRVTPALFAVANSPEALLQLGEERLCGYIRSIGLYRSKARHLLAMCQLLIQAFGGQVPDKREELQRLPGVGRKTANVVLNVAFGQPTLAVDTHVFRVARRTGLAQGRSPEAVEQALLQVIELEFLPHAHHWLLLHGRHVCKARLPLCSSCIIRHHCLRHGVEP